jgi:hypothetical protein
MEMRIFARHLDRNRDWITALIEAHKAYCGTDYETFQRAIPELRSLASPWLVGFQAYTHTLWKRESRLRYMAALKANSGWGLTRPYERLLSFFTSYIMVQSGSAQLTLMADQYSLWRTARAIATGLYLIIFEAVIVSLIGFIDMRQNLSVDVEARKAFAIGVPKEIVVVWLLTILGQVLIMYITLATYSRLCFGTGRARSLLGKKRGCRFHRLRVGALTAWLGTVDDWLVGGEFEGR